MEKHELNGVMILEESVEVIIESLGDDFSWSGFTACDCGASPVGILLCFLMVMLRFAQCFQLKKI
ncbi:MAG: hypothetical protein IJU92_04570 [Spirochaetaceae bacterium]|nr:hypothetical protein [Spirochaetaceae bacterium]